ncbi:hypothetical protein U4X35_23460, partial [Escherichia coli]|nr:hypothetical protein [Escherichia coli]
MGLMASFERGMERFLVPVAIKLNSQKHVAAVRDGFVFTFPIIMASSLIILINFAILSPDGFIAGLLHLGNDSNLLIVFYVQIMPDDFVMQLH